MNYINKNHILYAGLKQSINRGTVDILEENKQGIFSLKHKHNTA